MKRFLLGLACLPALLLGVAACGPVVYGTPGGDVLPVEARRVIDRGQGYWQACGVRMAAVSTTARGETYLYYRCQNNGAGMHGRNCAGNIPMASLDAQIWAKVWKVLTEKGEFELALEARIAELQAEDVDAEFECARLHDQLDTLLMERQKVITGWRKGKMTDTDYDLQLGALTIEQAGIQMDLNKNSLLVGNQAEKLMAIADR